MLEKHVIIKSEQKERMNYMSLKDTLTTEIKDAMKAKDAEKLQTLRGLKNTLQNEEIKLKKDLSSEEELTIVNREVKQTKEELEGFKGAKGDYAEVIEKLEKRLVELARFLPEQLSAEQVENIVKETIASIGATSKADMGKVMGAVMPKLKGKADGKLINTTVAKLLN